MNNHILYKCYNCISYTTSRISMSSKPGVIDCPPLLVNNSYYSFQRRTRESAVCLRALPVSPLVHTERLKWSLHLLLLLLFCLSLSLFSFSSSWGRVISLIVGSHCFRRNLFHGSSVVSGDTHKTNCQRGGVNLLWVSPCSVSMLMPPIVFFKLDGFLLEYLLMVFIYCANLH